MYITPATARTVGMHSCTISLLPSNNRPLFIAAFLLTADRKREKQEKKTIIYFTILFVALIALVSKALYFL